LLEIGWATPLQLACEKKGQMHFQVTAPLRFYLQRRRFRMSFTNDKRELLIFVNATNRDGQYLDTCIGDTYRAILLYRYRFSISRM